MSDGRPIRCTDCGRQRPHRGRGLCGGCYTRATVAGTITDHETTDWPADDLLDEWARLRDDGTSVRDAARRIGVTYAALDKALWRAARRGDRRGSRVPYGHDMREVS